MSLGCSGDTTAAEGLHGGCGAGRPAGGQHPGSGGHCGARARAHGRGREGGRGWWKGLLLRHQNHSSSETPRVTWPGSSPSSLAPTQPTLAWETAALPDLREEPAKRTCGRQSREQDGQEGSTEAGESLGFILMCWTLWSEPQGGPHSHPSLFPPHTFKCGVTQVR